MSYAGLMVICRAFLSTISSGYSRSALASAKASACSISEVIRTNTRSNHLSDERRWLNHQLLIQITSTNRSMTSSPSGGGALIALLTAINASLGSSPIWSQGHCDNRTTKFFHCWLSWGLSDQLLRSVFNALHVQTIIASIARASGWTLVQSPILFD